MGCTVYLHSVSDPDPYSMAFWLRVRIRITDPCPDQGSLQISKQMLNWAKKYFKLQHKVASVIL